MFSATPNSGFEFVFVNCSDVTVSAITLCQLICGCADVNECKTKNGGCHAKALCINTVGSRKCKCKPPYIGNGITCKGKSA